MQHEIVVYNYKGPGDSVQGEAGEIPYPEGLPFSKSVPPCSVDLVPEPQTLGSEPYRLFYKEHPRRSWC